MKRWKKWKSDWRGHWPICSRGVQLFLAVFLLRMVASLSFEILNSLRLQSIQLSFFSSLKKRKTSNIIRKNWPDLWDRRNSFLFLTKKSFFCLRGEDQNMVVHSYETSCECFLLVHHLQCFGYLTTNTFSKNFSGFQALQIGREDFSCPYSWRQMLRLCGSVRHHLLLN